MQVVICLHDGKLCDLNKRRHVCRFLRTWAGKCHSRKLHYVKRDELKQYEVTQHDKNKAAQERDKSGDIFRPQ